LPPPYEIYPHLFVDADVIQKAYEMRMMGEWSKHYVLMLISTLERKLHYKSQYTRPPLPEFHQLWHNLACIRATLNWIHRIRKLNKYTYNYTYSFTCGVLYMICNKIITVNRILA
jgi:hypothetical protein